MKSECNTRRIQEGASDSFVKANYSAQAKTKTGGDGNDYYVIPPQTLQLQDLIEFKNMNGNIKDVFKACYRVGQKTGTSEIYDVEKMAYYSLRELGRITGSRDYIRLAKKLMGSQSIPDEEI